MKKIGILGSTGSIGTQTLTVIDWHPGLFQVELLCANTNISLLKDQIYKYSPKYVVVLNKLLGEKLFKELKLSPTKFGIGMDGLMEFIEQADMHLLVTAFSGAVGLMPTLGAIKKGVNIALANKETLVAAGKTVMEMARQKKVSIIPVDSEHSALFQCLKGEKIAEVQKLILTASGGPFRGLDISSLKNIKPEQALKHPRWQMGAKISIDSATMMNKGLEVIEAHWLFDLDFQKIEVIVHPQSIVHSMVQFIDGSILAQLGPPDMKIPIQYALSYPVRNKTNLKPLDLTEVRQLTFEAPDKKVFPALSLAYAALKIGGTMPAVLNGANEVAVALFLTNKISFLEIPQLIEQVMNDHRPIMEPDLDQILAADNKARTKAKKYIEKVVD